MVTIQKDREIRAPIVRMQSRPRAQQELVRQNRTAHKLQEAGFKKVTDRDIEKQLGCAAIQVSAKQQGLRQLNARAIVRRIEWGCAAAVWSMGFTVGLIVMACAHSVHGLIGNSLLPYLFWPTAASLIPGILAGYRMAMANATNFKCRVVYDALDSYKADIIPDRCYQNLSLAKSAGAKTFFVAYPTLENEKQRDPLLLARVGEEWYEIDMWE